MSSGTLRLEDLEALVFDFDGVLTDDGVFVDQDGKESVRCNRRDGLAFDVFRKLGIKVYIISTEKNTVVSARASKLKVPVLQGIGNKSEALKVLAKEEKIDLSKVLYVGNDLNDWGAMGLCGFSACPSGSHQKIVEISDIQLKTAGGLGVVRELVEDVLGINILQVLYS